jgi:glycosyltransferase involved in cell wall biosynthesis
MSTSLSPRSPIHPSASNLTIVALLVGEVAALGASARQWLFDLKYYAERDANRIPIVLVVDGAQWLAWLDDPSVERPAATTIVVHTSTHHPGALLNRALEAVDTAWFTVFAVGSEVSTWYGTLDARLAAIAQATQSGASMLAGYRSHLEGRTAANESWLVHQDDGFSSDYPNAWLQMLDLVPMTNACVRRDAVARFGGFTDAPQLQRIWWWEWCQRVSAREPIFSVPMHPAPGVNWHHYPFAVERADSVPNNLARLMVLQSEPQRCLPAREDELLRAATPQVNTAVTQSTAWRQLPMQLRQRLAALVSARGRKLRVVVLGGVNEPAHNQLCFFNYFASMRSWGVLEWRSILDVRARVEDLENADLVVFSRVRSANGVALMEACRAAHPTRQIRTLYMLDDNWFWLGREWEEYAPYFTPGKPDYENFLACVRHADITLTYSQPLADDLAPHARRVMTIPTNVDFAAFDATPRGTHSRVRIGFVGSLRRNMIAFDALVEVARARQDVDVFVMSNALPPEFAALPDSRVLFQPYQFNYAAYARTVREAAPDVLVAPVNRSRFEASKCPNKFFEISACGAAGVYSRAEPYLSYVVDGETGLFADDTREAWVAAITRLIDDAALRRHVTTTARATVRAQWDTAAVLPRFLKLLCEAIEPEPRIRLA